MSKSKIKPLTKLKIDRAIWCRGNINLSSSGESQLLTDNGTMCCLGFVGVACGIKEKDLFDVADPFDLTGKAKKIWPTDDDNYHAGDILNDLLYENDNPNITEKKREVRIINLMKRAGVKVTFYGKTPRR